MRLSIGEMPSELSNYLQNAYELQYELYDYLYTHGIKNARDASVTGYYIDGDEKTATIQIKVIDAGNVTALYNRDDNSYSFW